MSDEAPETLFERLRLRGNPVANPKSVVVSDQARFTILTPRLLRLEWSETGEFEDRATYAFPTRHGPAPQFVVREDGNTLVIETAALVLRYDRGSGPFSADHLQIAFDLDGERRTWRPGMSDPLNLRGTRRTLDECGGDAALDQGILSRAGWALFDDSRSVVFDPQDGWVAPRPDHALQDWVFFCYGRDYKAALGEYTRFGGPIPLIPRFVLGAWWSRYWAYSDQDIKDLVMDFEAHDLPLDVLVVDMDWHTPHAWTGYTWNRELFPDPPAFLKWVHDRGLRVTLNLHPAQGVQPFEEVYPRFAEAMGVDPAGGEPIPFRIADKEFVRHYFELLHHPLEDDGVDFWWMDWQQGEGSEVRGLDPLPWLNHLHFQDSTRRGGRPMLYSRWGGLGNHRYPIGFSGDTYVTWSALQFQPTMTAAASNVLYGWWSHDIGGHMGGATDPELYARWVQFGALSPCLRLHSTKDARAERRPWKYPEEVYQAAKRAFALRIQLVPYLYTMARAAYDTGVCLCRPMTYEYPNDDAATVVRDQYFLGDQVIAAPIVHPADPRTGMAAADVWVPGGTWIDYQTKETFVGPRWVRLVGGLDRVPMLVKAGAILPLAAPARTTDAIPGDHLILSVFPGADGAFRLYEDDGLGEGYKEGQCEWTEVRTRIEDGATWEVEVAPVEGCCESLPAQRRYEVRLEGSSKPCRVMVDGVETSAWTYDTGTLTTTIQVELRDKRQPVTITALARGSISALGEAWNREQVLSDVRRLLGERCPRKPGDVDGVLRLDVPGRADAVARLGGPFVRFFEYTTPEEASRQLGRVVVGGTESSGEPYDLDVVFTLFQAGRSSCHTVRREGGCDAQVIETPFALDGQVQAGYWEALARITWRGSVLEHPYRSGILFPSLHTWRVLVYRQDEHPAAVDQVLDGRGLDGTLGWALHRQDAAGLRQNVNGLYVVDLGRDHGEQLAAGDPLSAVMVTTIVSPDEREAVIKFQAFTSWEFTLNGERVDVARGGEEAGMRPPFFRLWAPVRRTAVMRLREGANALVVHARSVQLDPSGWTFAGAVMTSGGELMPDLIIE